MSTDAPLPEQAPEQDDAWSNRLFGGFRKTSERLTGNLSGIVGKTRLDDHQLDDQQALVGRRQGGRRPVGRLAGPGAHRAIILRRAKGPCGVS